MHKKAFQKCTFNLKTELLPANEVWSKVMFLHLSVILFTGGCLSQHAVGGCTPPWADNPTRQTPADPPGRHSPRQTPPSGRHPLLRMATEAGGTHPTGMHSCFRISSVFKLVKLNRKSAICVFRFFCCWPLEVSIIISGFRGL